MVLARASKERAHDPSDPYRAVPDEQALVSRPPQLETLIGPVRAFKIQSVRALDVLMSNPSGKHFTLPEHWPTMPEPSIFSPATISK